MRLPSPPAVLVPRLLHHPGPHRSGPSRTKQCINKNSDNKIAKPFYFWRIHQIGESGFLCGSWSAHWTETGAGRVSAVGPSLGGVERPGVGEDWRLGGPTLAAATAGKAEELQWRPSGGAVSGSVYCPPRHHCIPLAGTERRVKSALTATVPRGEKL